MRPTLALRSSHWAALGIVVVNYSLYLPFLTYEGWGWLRFMLPALTALFILFAALRRID